MAALGYTLNQITMLALTLMVGIVIDDAIVVLENFIASSKKRHSAVSSGD
jgi:multidrug efflux pump subunit AcrB